MSTIARQLAFALLSFAILGLISPGIVRAADEPQSGDKSGEKSTEKSDAKQTKAEASESTGSSTAAASSDSDKSKAAEPKSKYRPYAEVLKEADTINGLIKLHRKGGTVYAEISPSQLNKDFIVVISIARGIGRGTLLAGMSWGFGDDWIWQFRKVDDYVHVVRRNVRFTATKGSPEERAVGLGFTDSILFSLPIVTMSPSGGIVVDLNGVFMSDLPLIAHELPGFSFSPQRSTWAAAKSFPDNIELEVAATYASSGTSEIDNVPDTRGATINVHYSISYLPQNGYHPRVADDRIGYFLTVLKDYSQKGDDDQFVRYINRWDLAKADPTADISPPKKPIVFWLEKTIPYKYRAPIRDGILEWNRALDKAGFSNAIEVRQQPENADWDPEDINYNTFRWITTNTERSAAMGPSRVNPTNGQILNAQIIFDADFLRAWKTNYETFSPNSIAAFIGGNLDIRSKREQLSTRPSDDISMFRDCELASARSMDIAFGGAALAAAASEGTKSEADLEKLVRQGLKEVTMHEVGHTLGLRHNFKASAYLSLDDIQNPEKTKDTGLTASVMDYAPVNIAPKGKKQGDFYSQTIGPYDMWAIEYGYKPISDGEKKELGKIASRSAEPALRYATDEDTRGTRDGINIDADPLSNQFDLGSDTMEYAKQRAELISGLWSTVVDRVVKEGEDYHKARQTFGILLVNYGRAMHYVARYIGGTYVNRSHKGDAEAADPFVVVEAKKQREALELLAQQVFNDKPFNFPPELYNHLASSRWEHWGADVPLRSEYPIHHVLALWQNNILDQLLCPITLDRLHDSELKVPADQDAFTTVDLISGLTKAIFSEVDSVQGGEFTNRKPAISSLRRNLQREYLSRLSKLAMGDSQVFMPGTGHRIDVIGAPEDCQTVAFAELKSLQERMNKLLASNVKLDDYTRDHLTESAARIGKVLDARLQLSSP
jgi:Met-zincin/Domain of unknown function (DUF5117)/Domain of unknown function (DUF5118)